MMHTSLHQHPSRTPLLAIAVALVWGVLPVLPVHAARPIVEPDQSTANTRHKYEAYTSCTARSLSYDTLVQGEIKKPVPNNTAWPIPAFRISGITVDAEGYVVDSNQRRYVCSGGVRYYETPPDPTDEMFRCIKTVYNPHHLEGSGYSCIGTPDISIIGETGYRVQELHTAPDVYSDSQSKFDKYTLTGAQSGDFIVVDMEYTGPNQTGGFDPQFYIVDSTNTVVGTHDAKSDDNVTLYHPTDVPQHIYKAIILSGTPPYTLAVGFNTDLTQTGTYDLIVRKGNDFDRCLAEHVKQRAITGTVTGSTIDTCDTTTACHSPSFTSCSVVPDFSTPLDTTEPLYPRKHSKQISPLQQRSTRSAYNLYTINATAGTPITVRCKDSADPYDYCTATLFEPGVTWKGSFVAEKEMNQSTTTPLEHTPTKTGEYVLMVHLSSKSYWSTWKPGSVSLTVTGASGGGTPSCTTRGDVNCDGNVSIGDVVLVRRFVATGELPAELTAIGNARLKLPASGTACSSTPEDVTIGDLVLLRGMVVDPAASRSLCTLP